VTWVWTGFGGSKNGSDRTSFGCTATGLGSSSSSAAANGSAIAVIGFVCFL